MQEEQGWCWESRYGLILECSPDLWRYPSASQEQRWFRLDQLRCGAGSCLLEIMSCKIQLCPLEGSGRGELLPHLQLMHKGLLRRWLFWSGCDALYLTWCPLQPWLGDWLPWSWPHFPSLPSSEETDKISGGDVCVLCFCIYKFIDFKNTLVLPEVLK